MFLFNFHVRMSQPQAIDPEQLPHAAAMHVPALPAGAACSEPRAAPTCDAIVRRGFSSAASSLGISFITIATALSAALEPFPYNRETNKGESAAARAAPARRDTRRRVLQEARSGSTWNAQTLFKKNNKSAVSL